MKNILKILLYMFAFAWFILGLCAAIPALFDKDVYTAIVGLIITILPFIVYFVVRHQSKNEADEFSDMLLKKEEFYNANNNKNNKIQEEPSNTPDIYEKGPLLIKCPACGKEVSNQAVSCPNCGHPIAEMIKEKELEEEAKQIARYSQIEEYGKKKHKNNKKKNGCLAGCVTFIICIAVIGFAVHIMSRNPEQFDGTGSQSAKAIGIEQEVGEKIDNILSQCGLTNIKSIQHDELLDNAHFEGEKGYRVSANGVRNVILYLYANNVVYSVRYADNDLFLKGNLIATINDFTMSIEEISKWQVLCEDKVRSILKSPSTAKFPNYTKWGFHKDKGIVTIQGYVDSQNGFGAEIRSKFQFIVNSDDNTIQSFIFDGQELIN